MLVPASRAVSYSPLFTALLAKRGLTDPEAIEDFLYPELGHLRDPFLMKGMEAAVGRIRRAVREREKILVHGDYDVDGITGTALICHTLARLGATFQSFLPSRTQDGYGVSVAALQRARSEGVSLILTVDCGTSAVEEIRVARSLGLDVLVIDHHRLPAEGLPPATAILNPLQEDCPYPFKELSAAGLAFKLSQALIGEEALSLLDLAALSTVSDVAPLREENRVIVKKGLELLSARRRVGIRALASAAGLRAREMNVGHIGFVLGPRLNAAGRMSSPEIALRLLLTDHEREAESLAEALNHENQLRQREERRVLKEAVAEVERTVNFNRDRVIVVAHEGWHAGVIGIVASRLVERYYRPALVIAIDGAKGQGSGRSVKGFHLFNALKACEGDLIQFGGHEQAAGFAVVRENIAGLRQRMNHHARENYAPEIFVRSVTADLEVAFREIDAAFLEELKLMEPHGPANPRPVFFSPGLEVKTKPAPAGPESYRFWVTDGELTSEAVWQDRSRTGEATLLAKGARLDLLYTVKGRNWDGVESLLLEVKAFKPGP